jgi:Single-strand binding protein family
MSGLETAFIGTLARDAEHKTAKSGKHYLRFSCRVDDGNAVTWVSVMTFDQAAIEQPDKFVKGARCYIEDGPKREQWSGQDGVFRHGLSCPSWHTRLSEICRNRPKRECAPELQRAAWGNTFFDDEIGF